MLNEERGEDTADWIQAAEEGCRDTSDIIEKYKKGMLGALPEPEFFESLLEVKNDVETAEH